MNQVPQIQLELWLGEAIPSPAPTYVTEMLQSAEIQRDASGPSSFQLVFHADRTLGLSPDFALLSGGLLKAWNRVLIGVRLDGAFTVLMDGFITHQELAHDKQFGASTLTVSGEDVSILMDRLQISLEYPQMGDAIIAGIVLAKYSLIGVLPEIIPTPLDLIPLVVERVPQQNGTDRAFLNEMACRNGFRFAVRPGPEPLTNIAYFGPPLNVGSVQPALSIDVGAGTNVERISFKLDSSAPTAMFGMVQDNITEIDAPLTSLPSSRLPPLASDPALDLLGLMQRRDIYTDPRLGYLQAFNEVQTSTDISTDHVLVVDGELDTLRYGAVLEAPGLVDLRGAGQSYDGRYRVEKVTHKLARGSYSQSFNLAREGTGSTISQVAA
ncbi:MAG: hypothetical protein C0515_00740 [Novosphingobium sp.]|nr:hypothetical protein [Novosphingobium sp.]MBX9643792.1 hypothetical protein [Novosphingobium sp.]